MGTKLTKGGGGPTLAEATEIIWHKTPMRMYGVSDSQLEELTAGYNSLHLILFGIFLGAAPTLFIAFKQCVSSAPEKPYYLACTVATLGLAVLFGINGIGNYVRASRRKSKLYKESIPIER